jgi:flagellar assembly protein FliH
MASKTIYAASAQAYNFADRIESVSKEIVDANIPSSRKVIGRTAEALARLRAVSKKEGFEEGYVHGFEQGEEDARQSVESRTEQTIQDFAHILQDKSDQVVFAAKAWANESEHLLAELSILIASRILGQELRLDHDTITAIAKDAIKEVLLAEKIRIRVNPFDVPIIAQRKQELLAVNKQLRDIEIVDDPSITGGCVVESDAGIVDASIETKLGLLFEAMKEAA